MKWLEGKSNSIKNRVKCLFFELSVQNGKKDVTGWRRVSEWVRSDQMWWERNKIETITFREAPSTSSFLLPFAQLSLYFFTFIPFHITSKSSHVTDQRNITRLYPIKCETRMTTIVLLTHFASAGDLRKKMVIKTGSRVRLKLNYLKRIERFILKRRLWWRKEKRHRERCSRWWLIYNYWLLQVIYSGILSLCHFHLFLSSQSSFHSFGECLLVINKEWDSWTAIRLFHLLSIQSHPFLGNVQTVQ